MRKPFTKKQEIIYTKLDLFIIEKRNNLNDVGENLKKDLKEVIALKRLLDYMPYDNKILSELKQKQKQLSNDIICYNFAREELKTALNIDGNKEFTKGWIIEMFDPSITILMDTCINFYNSK